MTFPPSPIPNVWSHCQSIFGLGFFISFPFESFAYKRYAMPNKFSYLTTNFTNWSPRNLTSHTRMRIIVHDYKPQQYRIFLHANNTQRTLRNFTFQCQWQMLRSDDSSYLYLPFAIIDNEKEGATTRWSLIFSDCQALAMQKEGEPPVSIMDIGYWLAQTKFGFLILSLSICCGGVGEGHLKYGVWAFGGWGCW